MNSIPFVVRCLMFCLIRFSHHMYQRYPFRCNGEKSLHVTALPISILPCFGSKIESITKFGVTMSMSSIGFEYGTDVGKPLRCLFRSWFTRFQNLYLGRESHATYNLSNIKAVKMGLMSSQIDTMQSAQTIFHSKITMLQSLQHSQHKKSKKKQKDIQKLL